MGWGTSEALFWRARDDGAVAKYDARLSRPQEPCFTAWAPDPAQTEFLPRWRFALFGRTWLRSRHPAMFSTIEGAMAAVDIYWPEETRT